MRLTKIKLVGFKSFVDPTTLIVPGNLVGVVGPNGCGKSNIIDALTWVMGESSAKHLRGDNLTDVIFNGSGTRKPVGQASVELVFDNSEGKLGGQYGSYNEISIKRQMSREGVSTYFLNGTRCRRKDIQGIFLGTGLGPRSYAIIEQGVISRLIEAKPEELRLFIEEAAGISKFRERRRETENRMRHTRDNIDRLNDIREELSKQLGHLQRQARAAERYQVLKKQERQLKTEMLALNWQDLDGKSRHKNEKVRLQENELEKANAIVREIEATIEKQRDDLSSANEGLNHAQSAYYQIGGEISQIEQKIQHTKERIQGLEADLSETQLAVKSADSQLTNDREKLKVLAEEAKTLEPQLDGTRTQSTQAYDALNHAEEAMQSWQSEWDLCLETAADSSRQLELDEARLEYLRDNIEEKSFRRESLIAQLEEIDTRDVNVKLSAITTEIEKLESTIQEGKDAIVLKQSEIQKLRADVHGLNEALATKRTRLHKLEGKIASLDSLQQHASGTDNEHIIEWLTEASLNKASPLAQLISVEPEWILAVETVLAHHLQDLCVDNLEDVASRLSSLQQAKIGFVSRKSGNTSNEGKSTLGLTPLSDKVSSNISIAQYLQGIYIAEDLPSALANRQRLALHESIVIADGIWLGKEWIRVNRPQDDETGVLVREQQLQSMRSSVDAVAKEINALEASLEKSNAALTEAEENLQSKQSDLNQRQESLSTLLSSKAGLQSRVEQSEERSLQLRDEQEDLDQQQSDEKEEIESIQQRLNRARSDNLKLVEQRDNLNQLREQHRQNLDAARSQWQSTHEQSHEIALKLESISSQRASLDQAIQRIEIQLSSYNARIEELGDALSKTHDPLFALEASLEEKLKTRLASENTLTEARKKVQLIEDSVRGKEQERIGAETTIQNEREKLEGLRLQAQEITVRLQTIFEQFKEQNEQREIKTILDELDEAANKKDWEEKISSTERKISRLGPINLAAIDEFTQLSERKEYLDSQDTDLVEALTTLENAIKKIDRETRTRFQETFDELNKNLQEMFPVLFGGGHAYLELTGNDLLDTGVTVMAQPPGKRNSTIHLLSGGEKALTAVALVFSIFKLNPAPFCILDEVDAPLDDLNTTRYSNLVKEMSKDVQFIFITHNKITMEIAQQLLGVTMHEPGVSRMVSVDMDEAVEMAASA